MSDFNTLPVTVLHTLFKNNNINLPLSLTTEAHQSSDITTFVKKVEINENFIVQIPSEPIN